MITVRKSGDQYWCATCDNCDCIFTYNLTDTTLDTSNLTRYVMCPECGKAIIHSFVDASTINFETKNT